MVSPLQSFLSGKQQGQQIAQQRLNLQEQQANQPVRNALRNLQLQQTGAQQRQLSDNEQTRRLRFLNSAARHLANVANDPQVLQSEIAEIERVGQSFGIDPGTISQNIRGPQDIQNMLSRTSAFLRDPSQLTAAQRDFQAKSRILEGAFDAQGNVKSADQLSAQQQLLLKQEGFTGKVPSLTAEEVGRRERAKLTAQQDLKPSLQFAVKSAEEQAKRISTQTTEKRESLKALDVYEGAFKNLADSLGKAFTGPGVQLIPAISADAQTAEAAIAAMAPILKQIFRTAGEGTFTDQDQKLLQQMIPDRGMHPEARAQALKNIDLIIRSKLNVAAPERQQAALGDNESATSQQTFTSSGGVTFTVE